MIWFVLSSGFFALIFSGFLIWQVLRRDAGTPRMKEISAAIREGSTAYLNRQYKTLLPMVAVLFVLLYFLINAPTAITFLLGVFLSALAGNIGMNISVRSNARVAQAAKRGLREALNVAFKGGTVTGLG